MQKQTLATVTSGLATGDEPSITISTIALDREHDEIVPEGCDFAGYLRNPVVLFGHDSSSLPVGTTTHIEVSPGRGIRASWRWLEGDEFAARVRNAYEQGMLRAASIGFLPTDSERNASGGQVYTGWKLLEWSLVPVPANPEAVRTLKRLDLWHDDEAVLDLADERDEPLLDIDPRDFREAVREVMADVRAELARAVVRQVVAELDYQRGRVVDCDPLGDRVRSRRVELRDFVFSGH